jgi:hypothetical protein
MTCVINPMAQVMTRITPVEVTRPATLFSKANLSKGSKMLRAWLLTLDILIRIGLVRLLKQEQSEKLDQHQFSQNKEQQHRNCDEDRTD